MSKNTYLENYMVYQKSTDKSPAFNYTIHAGSEVFVFKGQRGTLSPQGVQLMLNRLRIPEQLRVISPHHFRNTFSKNLVDAGISLGKVAILAGHERLDTTKSF